MLNRKLFYHFSCKSAKNVVSLHLARTKLQEATRRLKNTLEKRDSKTYYSNYFLSIMDSKKTFTGETSEVSQQGTLAIEMFLNENYRFRRNMLNGKVEFATLPEGPEQYRDPCQA